MKEVKLDIDPVLLPFVVEDDVERANAVLSNLITNVTGRVIEPIIKAALPDVARSNAIGPDDLRSEVILRIVKRVQRLKSNAAGDELTNFAGYVASTCYNVCWSFLRSRHPERGLLKDRLRYALRHSRDLFLWQSGDGSWVGGYKEWRGKNMQRCAAGQIAALAQNASLLEFAWEKYGDCARLNALPLLGKIFDLSRLPIGLNELVELVAEIWGMQEPSMLDISTVEDIAGAQTTQTALTILPGYRVNLHRLWEEVCGLPLRQRVALLLTLHDDKGADVITLLGSASVASIRDISEVLEIPAIELAGFWEELPYDDLRVAQYLDVTRQQVVNLRKSARKRLSYRLNYHEK